MARSPGTSDYRDLKPSDGRKPERNDRPQQDPSRRWWDKKGKECAESIAFTIAFLMKAQADRLRQVAIGLRLYGGVPQLGSQAAAFARLAKVQNAARDRVTYNAVQSIVDTGTSFVGQRKPRAYYLTSGGDYRQQRKAKRLTELTDGIFYETKTYPLGADAFRDSMVVGDGLVHAFVRGKKIHHERVLSSDLWVDEEEAKYGRPRNLHYVQDVDRDELAAYFPEHRAAIMDASKTLESSRAQQTNSDLVTVAESWHLGAIGESGKVEGGLHGIALVSGGVMLVEPEEWPHEFFPFAKMPWCKRLLGYWSQSLAEQLQGDQIALNEKIWLTQRSMKMAGSFKVLLPNGSKVVKEHLTNDIGAVIGYAGDKPPQYVTVPPLDAMIYQSVHDDIERMYRKAGFSELSASQKKPAGINSGKALREYKDTQDDRQKSIGEQYDEFYMDLANIDRCLAAEIPGYTVRVPGKALFRQVNFSRDVGKIRSEEFVMQRFPTSQLPREPAGRMATIQEWIQAGWITPRQGRRAMDFPDLDTIESLANAQEDLLSMVLDDIIDEGNYRPPEPTDDLALAKEMVLEYIQRYRTLDLEPEKMDLLRQWNMQVDQLGTLAAAPMPGQAPAAPGAPPQAQPAAAPQSDLLPQAA